MLNAGRRYLGLKDLTGRVFLTSGLGGMSGAQAKAATICGCIGVVAEVRAPSSGGAPNYRNSSATNQCCNYRPGQLRGSEETLRPGMDSGND